MLLQGKMQARIILRHMLAEAHARQHGLGLRPLLLLHRGGEERQRRVAHALQGPERLAPVEADGAAGIGPGERLQAALGEPGAAPERQRIGIAVAALGDQALGLREMEALHLAQAEAEGEGLGGLGAGEVALGLGWS